MRWPGSFIAAALVVGIAGPSSAGQVQLAIHGGLVTLDAKDATLREIFAEWARVGQTRIVNSESVIGGPVTLLMTDVPERRALETLLRSVAGYVAAPRPVQQPALSTYDRIVLMPGARPAAVQVAGQHTGKPCLFDGLLITALRCKDLADLEERRDRLPRIGDRLLDRQRDLAGGLVEDAARGPPRAPRTSPRSFGYRTCEPPRPPGLYQEARYPVGVGRYGCCHPFHSQGHYDGTTRAPAWRGWRNPVQSMVRR